LKDPVVYVEYIHDAIFKIKEYTNKLSQENFLESALIQDAVIRNFELIGVASKNIDDVFKKKYENIEWSILTGIRRKLTHDFIGVDLWAVWGAVKNVLPELETHIAQIIYIEKNSKSLN
jgi:uncharacterized protein with HEPN domain